MQQPRDSWNLCCWSSRLGQAQAPELSPAVRINHQHVVSGFGRAQDGVQWLSGPPGALSSLALHRLPSILSLTVQIAGVCILYRLRFWASQVREWVFTVFQSSHDDFWLPSSNIFLLLIHNPVRPQYLKGNFDFELCESNQRTADNGGTSTWNENTLWRPNCAPHVISVARRSSAADTQFPAGCKAPGEVHTTETSLCSAPPFHCVLSTFYWALLSYPPRIYNRMSPPCILGPFAGTQALFIVVV